MQALGPSLDLRSIKAAEFVPAPPPRADQPLHKVIREMPIAARQHLFNSSDLAPLPQAVYFTSEHPSKGLQYLTVLAPSVTSHDSVLLVLDTLTHMHKADLSPFALRRTTLAGKTIHYGRFELPTSHRATIGIIRYNQAELLSFNTREQWRHFFSSSENLLRLSLDASPTPSETLRNEGVSILEPEHQERSREASPATPPHTTHEGHLAGLQDGHHVSTHLFLPDSAKKLLIVSDGKTYLDSYPLWPFIQRHNRAYPDTTTALLLLEPTGSLSRQQFLGEELYLSTWLDHIGFQWVGERFSTPSAVDCIIAGGSLGGLAAAQVVREIPHRVSKAVVQSGAFWWSSYEASQAEGQVLEEWLTAELPENLQIWCEVGSYEGFLLPWNRSFAAVLEQRNIQHTYREYVGGHDYACWRQGILDALPELA